MQPRYSCEYLLYMYVWILVLCKCRGGHSCVKTASMLGFCCCCSECAFQQPKWHYCVLSCIKVWTHTLTVISSHSVAWETGRTRYWFLFKEQMRLSSCCFNFPVFFLRYSCFPLALALLGPVKAHCAVSLLILAPRFAEQNVLLTMPSYSTYAYQQWWTELQLLRCSIM